MVSSFREKRKKYFLKIYLSKHSFTNIYTNFNQSIIFYNFFNTTILALNHLLNYFEFEN